MPSALPVVVTWLCKQTRLSNKTKLTCSAEGAPYRDTQKLWLSLLGEEVGNRQRLYPRPCSEAAVGTVCGQWAAAPRAAKLTVLKTLMEERQCAPDPDTGIAVVDLRLFAPPTPAV